jgi:hypothetical protein
MHAFVEVAVRWTDAADAMPRLVMVIVQRRRCRPASHAPWTVTVRDGLAIAS